MGTLLAVVAYFWRDLWQLAVGLRHKDGASIRYFGMIVIASVPTAVLGLLLRPWVEDAIRSPRAASGFLLLTAAALFATKYLTEGNRFSADINWPTALLVGLAQGVAVFPGVSRSGITIAAALAAKIERDSAFRFSFLISIPAIAGAFCLEVPDALRNGALNWTHAGCGFLLAFGVGLLALWILKKSLAANWFHHYAWWCLAAAGVGFIFG